MTLGERQINSISRTRIAFWNHRGDPIQDSDIVESDPLRVQLDARDEVLQARVLATSRKITNVALQTSQDLKSVAIEFKFLDTWDGGVIEVIHKGSTKPSIMGTIQGCDLYSNGSADLSPDALKAVGEESAWRRFRTYGRGRLTLKRFLTGPAVAIAVAVALGVLSLFVTHSEPNHLINTHRYKLNTITGQVHFAKAVSDLQAFNPNQNVTTFAVTVLPLVALIIILTAYSFYRITRRKVPGRIVTDLSALDETDKDGVNLVDPSPDVSNQLSDNRPAPTKQV